MRPVALALAKISKLKAGTPIDQLVLFPTDDAAVDVAKALGVGHYRHASFGQFPKEEAASYGDNTFVAMMWIKVLCAYLPVNLGYSVLFQDADVVWLRDPLKEYFNVPELAVRIQRRFSRAQFSSRLVF